MVLAKTICRIIEQNNLHEMLTIVDHSRLLRLYYAYLRLQNYVMQQIIILYLWDRVLQEIFFNDKNGRN